MADDGQAGHVRRTMIRDGLEDEPDFARRKLGETKLSTGTTGSETSDFREGAPRPKG